MAKWSGPIVGEAPMAQSDGGEDAGKSSRSPSHSSNSRDGDEGARFHPFRRPKTPFSQGLWIFLFHLFLFLQWFDPLIIGEALMAQSDGGEAAGKSSRTPSHCPTLEMAMKVPASTLIAALKPPLLKVSFFSFLCFCDCHCWSWFLRRAWIWEEIGVFLNLCVFLRWLWVNYWKPSCMLRFWLRFFLICKSDTTLASFFKLIGRKLHPNELEFLFS